MRQVECWMDADSMPSDNPFAYNDYIGRKGSNLIIPGILTINGTLVWARRDRQWMVFTFEIVK